MSRRQERRDRISAAFEDLRTAIGAALGAAAALRDGPAREHAHAMVEMWLRRAGLQAARSDPELKPLFANPRLAEPVVTFRLKEGAVFDEYHLADRLRMNGWIVPAYTLPPNAEHVTILRVVVRNDFSRDKADMLLVNIAEACEYLDKAGLPPTPKPAAGHEKQRRRC